MYERSLNEAELILRTQNESLALVHKIWEEVVKRSKTSGFEVAALPDFTAMLEGDRRFQIIPPKQKSQEEEDLLSDSEIADEEMEKLGFYSEDQVRLRSFRVVKPIAEEEEEVGSIRRKAFVKHSEDGKKVNKIKSANAKNDKKRTTTRRKIKVTAQKKKIRKQKSKSRIQGKK